MNLRIREILKEKGRTAVWLACEIGIAQPSMSNIVNNRVSPSLDTLEKIAAAIGCEVSEFFEERKRSDLKCPNCGVELNVKIE